MKIMRIGIDLAKTIFQVHGVNAQEKPACGLPRWQTSHHHFHDLVSQRAPMTFPLKDLIYANGLIH